MKLTKEKIIILIVAVIAIVAIICGIAFSGKKDGTNKDTDAVSDASSETTEDGEDIYASATSFLTGEPISEDLVHNRPISVMVENTSAAKQYGLNSAGVIYECPVEGGITRLMAIFDDWENLEKIGNIRSCRPYYIYLAKEFDSIYIHVGQSIHAETVLNQGIVDDINALKGPASSITFFRTNEAKAPHNMFASPDSIKKGIAAEGYRTEYSDDYKGHYVFASKDDPELLENGEDIRVIQPYFFDNKPYFIYNEETGLYDRYQFGKAQTDLADGKQVSVKNVILQASSDPTGIYDGSQYLIMSVIGRGPGKYFTNGKMIDITWVKESEGGVTRYFDNATGDEIRINLGQTWVSVIQLEYMNDNKYYATEEDFKNR